MIRTADERAAEWVRRNAARLRAVGVWRERTALRHRTQTKPALRCEGMCPLTALHGVKAHGCVTRHSAANGLALEVVRAGMWSAGGGRDGACRAALEELMVAEAVVA